MDIYGNLDQQVEAIKILYKLILIKKAKQENFPGAPEDLI
jgi:hypothetical protein